MRCQRERQNLLTLAAAAESTLLGALQELRDAVLENNVVGVPNFAFFRKGERVASFRGAKKDLLLGSLHELESEEQPQQQLAF